MQSDNKIFAFCGFKSIDGIKSSFSSIIVPQAKLDLTNTIFGNFFLTFAIASSVPIGNDPAPIPPKTMPFILFVVIRVSKNKEFIELSA